MTMFDTCKYIAEALLLEILGMIHLSKECASHFLDHVAVEETGHDSHIQSISWH